MGISFSSGRRNQNHHHQNHHHPYYHPPPLPYPYPTTATTTTTTSDPSILSLPPPPPNTYTYSSQYPANPYHYNYQYPPAQVQSNYYYPPSLSSTPPPPQPPPPGWYGNGDGYGNHMVGRPNFPYFPSNYGNGWHHMREPLPPPPPPPYVEHQNAKVVKNDVNVHKDTIKLVVDENFPDCYLVSFVFDAHFDGSITVYYFAKEDKENFIFTPVTSTAINPVKVPFEKGIAQRFQQPSGTGIDLGFFDLECLEKPTEDDVFPLVIFAEVHSSLQDSDHDFHESSTKSYRRVQATQAVIEKKNDGPFQVKVIRQILWIDGVRYELRDIYGIGNASSEGFSDDDPGKECVICMTEPKNTAVIPCRHLCMCSDCAKELRLQTNKCPICRQPITELIEIKINTSSE
ncbi:hypothetical protein RND81_05G142800 [Saponaria officinalis]|uniref:RING-type E3 ubiquitin transferase n=1 Tax=Saponaria officinalis TaxID=3572 RepID=A0AAW1KT24_SAPOF